MLLFFQKSSFEKRPNLRLCETLQPAAFSKNNLALFIKMSSIGCRACQPCQSPSVNYTVNILTVLPVFLFPLSFFLFLAAKKCKNCKTCIFFIQKYVKRAVVKETTGKTFICSVESA